MIIRALRKLGTGQKRSALDTPSEAKAKSVSLGNLSQWQLIIMRFKRHRLAVFSLFVLVALYMVALFAEFFAPYSANFRDLDYMYAPPQLPKFNLEHGWHLDAVVKDRDPITFQLHYRVVPDEVVPLSFFVKGEPYSVLGLFEWDRRFFGVDHRALDAEPGEGAYVFYFLGADRYGHDIFSRVIFGARISLSIGLIAIFLTFILGIVIGGISGYKGGYVDDLIQRFIEIVNSFPQLPLWLALAAVMPTDWPLMVTYLGITVVLSLLGWTGLARVVRGKILSLREEDYAVAARLLGANHRRVLFRHLVPGFTSHIIVVLTLSVPAMILGETALSFLGLGLRPPVVSWGVMLQDTMQLQAVANYPWLLLPVLPIIVTVLAFNFLGDGMRDAADPYSSR
ncbi:MAG: ABC transporter permease [Opitutales bacterium]|nr:ABC transporter permease [Opitutales bacterium]